MPTTMTLGRAIYFQLVLDWLRKAVQLASTLTNSAKYLIAFAPNKNENLYKARRTISVLQDDRFTFPGQRLLQVN